MKAIIISAKHKHQTASKSDSSFMLHPGTRLQKKERKKKVK